MLDASVVGLVDAASAAASAAPAASAAASGDADVPGWVGDPGYGDLPGATATATAAAAGAGAWLLRIGSQDEKETGPGTRPGRFSYARTPMQ